MLRKQMLKQGAFLFRWRGHLPLFGLPLVVLAMMGFRYAFGSHLYDTLWGLFCLGISFSGLAIRAVTIGFIPPGTSGRSTKHQQAEKLNTTGVYSLVRHPLYLGNLFIIAGAALFVTNLWFFLFVVLGSVLYYERIIFAEESFLEKKFGSEFVEWASRTPLFVSSFKNYKPSDRPFDWRMVLRREHSGFFGIVATFTFLEILGDFIIHRRIVIDPLWAGIFLVGLVAFLILVFLKRRTRSLQPRYGVCPQEKPVG